MAHGLSPSRSFACDQRASPERNAAGRGEGACPRRRRSASVLRADGCRGAECTDGLAPPPRRLRTALCGMRQAPAHDEGQVLRGMRRDSRYAEQCAAGALVASPARRGRSAGSELRRSGNSASRKERVLRSSFPRAPWRKAATAPRLCMNVRRAAWARLVVTPQAAARSSISSRTVIIRDVALLQERDLDLLRAPARSGHCRTRATGSSGCHAP